MSGDKGCVRSLAASDAEPGQAMEISPRSGDPTEGDSDGDDDDGSEDLGLASELGSSTLGSSSAGSLSSLHSFEDLESWDSSTAPAESSDEELEEDSSNSEQPGGADAAANHLPGRAGWFRERLSEPLFPGAGMTLLSFCYVLLTMKRQHRVRNNFFNELLCLLAKSVFPANNCAPPSWYLMRKIVGCAFIIWISKTLMSAH